VGNGRWQAECRRGNVATRPQHQYDAGGARPDVHAAQTASA